MNQLRTTTKHTEHGTVQVTEPITDTSEQITEPNIDTETQEAAPNTEVTEEQPELVVLPHSVDIEVEDNVSKVYCTATGRRFSGWDRIKPNLEKGEVTLTVTVAFRSIKTIESKPEPVPEPTKDDRQIEMFPGDLPLRLKFTDCNGVTWFYINRSLYVDTATNDKEHRALENVGEQEAAQWIVETSGGEIQERIELP